MSTNITNHGTNTSVNRKPQKFFFEAIYNSETQMVRVVGEENIDVNVYLYNDDGILIDSSNIINTEFLISSSGIYYIHVIGDGWDAKGEISI